jgi:hypothetical protein
MRYEVDFENPRTGETRCVVVDLDGDEIAKAQASSDPDLFAMAYAARRAYQAAPRGFRHVAAPEGFRLLRPN